ncbi:thioredoxin family protein [Thalassotalea sp. G2M2-11]|uniref:thioredoxin family protein n=1 Tax=Thalassotalea sp. G2M2-11 TaxID=2787627 RepID=UPI0019D15E3F|nr:thioredoxin family protein [Thalassotalea sp. G2M2-11]
MKKIIISALIIFGLSQLTSCASTQPQLHMLVGETNTSDLFSRYPGFRNSFNAYQLSEQDTQTVLQWPEDVKIAVYFGTWCHDSQREVPRFLKLVNVNQTIALDLVALDYDKTDPAGQAELFGVKYTPTFIVFRGNKELGRIIERPKSSLVRDIDQLLKR